MIRFRVGSIPIEVHATHVLISAMIAWGAAGIRASTPWPRTILSDASHPLHGVVFASVFVLWILIVSSSLLVHELGHAIAVKLAGGKPTVRLVGLGGMTRIEAELDWSAQALTLLAGPAASLALGVFTGAIAAVGGALLPDPVRYLAIGACYGNLGWAVFNLLPVTSLPGGQITTVVLTHLMGRPGFLVAQWIALAFAALVLVFAIARREPFIAVVVALMVMRTFANLGAYQRGELPVGHAAHPLTAVIERAEALYRDRKLTEAELIASGVVEAADTPPLLRSRAHVLLGWIALKEGQGRRALDHFAQVQGLTVPPHALAAGFSLIGDETRAIPFWAQAAQTEADPVVLDEYAGALIRSGREQEARAFPGVRMARAFCAAERVHYVRKEFEQAARAAEAAFGEEPDPTLAYTAACGWAQAGRPEEALSLLALAAKSGYRNAAEARTDPDLKSLRGKPEFDGWLAALSQSAPS